MKKKILTALALFALIPLVSCDEPSPNNVATGEHFRGEVDNTLPEIEYPSVTIEGNDKPNPVDDERTLDVSDASISLGDEDKVDKQVDTSYVDKLIGKLYHCDPRPYPNIARISE